MSFWDTVGQALLCLLALVLLSCAAIYYQDYSALHTTGARIGLALAVFLICCIPNMLRNRYGIARAGGFYTTFRYRRTVGILANLVTLPVAGLLAFFVIILILNGFDRAGVADYRYLFDNRGLNLSEHMARRFAECDRGECGPAQFPETWQPWIGRGLVLLSLFYATRFNAYIKRAFVRMIAPFRFLIGRLGGYGMGGSALFSGLLDEWAKAFTKGAIYLGKSIYDPFHTVGHSRDRGRHPEAGRRQAPVAGGAEKMTREFDSMAIQEYIPCASQALRSPYFVIANKAASRQGGAP